jgi:hypothetical protein
MRISGRLLRVIALAALVATTMPACSFLRSIADRFSPPVTFVDQQYASVGDNLREAQGFNANLGAFISAKTLDDVIRNELKQTLVENASDRVRFDKLEPRVVLAPQGIIVDVDFDGLELTNKVRIKGSLRGLAAVATEDDSVLIRPSVASFKLTKLRLEGGGPVSPDLAALINTVVRTLADNVAGQFREKPIKLQLGWSLNLRANVEELNVGNSATVEAQNRSIALHLTGALALIDSEGLRILAQVDQTAAGPNARAWQTPSGSRHVTKAQFRQLFQKYTAVFDQEWRENLDPLVAAAPVEVYLSKGTIASLINRVTDQKIVFTYEYDVAPTKFNEVVEAKKSQVDCQKVYEPFRRDRYKRASCNWSCQRCVNPCSPLGHCDMCTNEPVCLATRAACNAKEEARVAQDNIEWEAERIQHNIKQEAEVAACNTWRETTSILAVGRFKGDFGASGKIVAATPGVKVDPQLSFVELKDFGAQVDGRFKLDMKVTPHDLGHVFFCVAPTNFDYQGMYAVVIPDATRRIGMTHEIRADDLILRAQLPPLDYLASVNPAPIEALIENEKFLATCPIAATVMFASVPAAKAASMFGLKQGTIIYDAALGNYKGVQQLGVIEHRLVPERVVLSNTRTIMIVPVMGAKSVQMFARSPL